MWLRLKNVEEKDVCPFFLLENSGPLSPWEFQTPFFFSSSSCSPGTQNFLSNYLGTDFLNNTAPTWLYCIRLQCDVISLRLITSILVGILIGKLTDETVQHENPLVQRVTPTSSGHFAGPYVGVGLNVTPSSLWVRLEACAPKSGQPAFESPLCSSGTGWPRVLSLSLSLYICKVESVAASAVKCCCDAWMNCMPRPYPRAKHHHDARHKVNWIHCC